MTNDNEKENIGAISNEENQQNVDAFTTANVQNYILAQRAENTVKKKNTTWTSGRGFFVNKRNRAIEDIPVEEMNSWLPVLWKTKRRETAVQYEPTALVSLASCLHSQEK